MSENVKLVLTLIIGYLLGSISTGVIVSRVFGHKDIRSEGSGNSGTTNMLRVMGKKYALLTFAGDLFKGIAAVLIGKAWLGTQAGEILGAFGAILGHNFPLYFGFKGGKGIPSGGAIAIMIDWRIALVVWGGFLILAILTRYVSLGSCWAGASFPFATWFVYHNVVITVLGAVIGLLILYMHRGNIKRLLTGTENKFSLHKRK